MLGCDRGFCVEEVIKFEASPSSFDAAPKEANIEANIYSSFLEWHWNNKNNKNLSFFQIPYNYHTQLI